MKIPARLGQRQRGEGTNRHGRGDASKRWRAGTQSLLDNVSSVSVSDPAPPFSSTCSIFLSVCKQNPHWLELEIQASLTFCQLLVTKRAVHRHFLDYQVCLRDRIGEGRAGCPVSVLASIRVSKTPEGTCCLINRSLQESTAVPR